jgi:hypothetical protein
MIQSLAGDETCRTLQLPNGTSGFLQTSRTTLPRTSVLSLGGDGEVVADLLDARTDFFPNK